MFRVSAFALGPVLCLLVVFAGSSAVPAPPLSRSGSQARFAALPLYFHPHPQAAPERPEFLARGAGFSLRLSPTETEFWPAAPFSAMPGGLPLRGSAAAYRPAAVPKPAHATRVELLGADPGATLEALEPLGGHVSFFQGNDPARWRTDLSTYARLRSRGVYPGIDLVHYGSRNRLEYDFILAPEASPEAITMRYSGADRLSVDPRGDLRVDTAAGEIVQERPVVYQEQDGKRVKVAGSYRLQGDRVGFEIGAYDRSRPLVIDPVLLLSSYLGGESDDVVTQVSVDNLGNTYVSGLTQSPAFASANPNAPAAGSTDLFVARINAAGTQLDYLAYLGGSGSDNGNGLAVDRNGNVFVAGTTNSADFPLEGASLRTTLGGPLDGVFAKLDPNGNLVYSTYLGGGALESANDVAVNASSTDIWVVGSTTSTDFPLLLPVQNALNPGATVNTVGGDAFICQFNGALQLQFSSYLGGGRGAGFQATDDFAVAVTTANTSDAFIVGNTLSLNFPALTRSGTTVGPAPQQSLGGESDAFVSRISEKHTGDPANALRFSTYLGGIRADTAQDVAGNATGFYVVGSTASTDFPLPPAPAPAVQRFYRGGERDGFLVKGALDGMAFTYGTYLGGIGTDAATGVAVDSVSAPTVTGSTSSLNFPMAQPLQAANRGLDDAFVTTLTPAGDGFRFSTYLGGAGRENRPFNAQSVGSVAVTATGELHLAGTTLSADFPLLQPIQNQKLGFTEDSWVARIAPALDAPQQLTATPQSLTEILLRWQSDITVSAEVEVERLSPGGSFARIFRGSNQNTYSDRSLSPGMQVTYRIRLRQAPHLSPYSKEVRAATRPALAPPTLLTATATTATSIRFEWTDNTPDEQGYELLVGDTIRRFFGTVSGRASLSIGTFQPDTEHVFKIRAFSGGFASAFSNEARARTFPAPVPPGNVRLTTLNATMQRIDWADTNGGRGTTELERKQSNVTEPFVVVLRVNATSIQSTHGGLLPGTSYTYRLRAVSGSARSPYTPSVSRLTQAAPSPPRNLEAISVIPTQVILRWEDVSSSETSYQVERKLDNRDEPFESIKILAANTTTYTDKTAIPQTSYAYRMRAVSGSFVSGYSNQAFVRTPLIFPRAPSELSATSVSATRVALSWTDNSVFEEGFRVERSEAGARFVKVGVVPKEGTAFVDRSVSGNRRYVYRVVAFNATGDSPASKQVGVATPLSRGRLSVEPTAVRIGRIRLNRKEFRRLSLVNTGPETLEVVIPTLEAPFRVKKGGVFRIEPGVGVVLTLRALPTRTGLAMATLRIRCDDRRDSMPVPVSVTGVRQ